VKPTKNCLKEGEGQVLRKGEFDQSTVDVWYKYHNETPLYN
jgi:hypothetical protein